MEGAGGGHATRSINESLKVGGLLGVLRQLHVAVVDWYGRKRPRHRHLTGGCVNLEVVPARLLPPLSKPDSSGSTQINTPS